ncbi:hypothetical protein AABB24_032733 [Solanum stoloniferum]|uniref:Uncharacterized protein n=1 Tax=Solanum stoloniferum TaxID=62892 RepID=A0ABD2RMH3_9SOLN
MVFIDRSDRFLVVVGTAPVHFSMQGTPSRRIKVFPLCKAINALFKIFSSRSFILPTQWLSKARHERIKKIGKIVGDPAYTPFYVTLLVASQFEIFLELLLKPFIISTLVCESILGSVVY